MNDWIREKGPTLLAVVTVLALLYLARLYNYLLFHTLVEFFTALVACGIFVIAWNSRHITTNNYFLFFGTAVLFVGATDLLHALAYKGMNIFSGRGANLSTQLWVIARYLQCSALLGAPLFLRRRPDAAVTLAVYFTVTVILLAAAFGGIFPDCYIEGAGLTRFKVISEYLFCLMLLGALLSLGRLSRSFDRDVVQLVAVGIGAFILSEFSFTLYTDVYGPMNMIGHFFKFIGFFLLYKAMIEIGLMRPYTNLLREVKLSQEEVESLNTELAARAATLQEVNSKLETANQDLEAFNYSVSHDLRGPLTVINGYSELLLTIHGKSLNEECREYLQKIGAGGARMQQLITTLLDFSRMQRDEINRVDFDLSEMVAQVAAELRLLKPERPVTFHIQQGVRANADMRLLRVLVENLLGNAWKYTGKREQAVIEFGALCSSGKTTYFVRDNGTGFDMAVAGRLFLPFHRLHGPEDFEGIGIGLATAKRIVERHGGQIRAEGEVDKGATFFFTFD